MGFWQRLLNMFKAQPQKPADLGAQAMETAQNLPQTPTHHEQLTSFEAGKPKP